MFEKINLNQNMIYINFYPVVPSNDNYKCIGNLYHGDIHKYRNGGGIA